jgi:hypothetical protein
MIKEILEIQHLDYKIFSKVEEYAKQVGVFYFRLFENSCHVQRTDYLLLCSKLVFIISSYSEIEISVINVNENRAIKLVDYYIPISKIQNSVIYNIIEKFICCESCEEYSELKEYLEDL